MLLTVAFVPTLLVKPGPFALSFTLGNIFAIACTFFAAGPRKQIESMSDPKHLSSAIIYLVALVLTIVSAIFVCHIPFTPSIPLTNSFAHSTKHDSSRYGL